MATKPNLESNDRSGSQNLVTSLAEDKLFVSIVMAVVHIQYYSAEVAVTVEDGASAILSNFTLVLIMCFVVMQHYTMTRT